MMLRVGKGQLRCLLARFSTEVLLWCLHPRTGQHIFRVVEPCESPSYPRPTFADVAPPRVERQTTLEPSVYVCNETTRAFRT